MNSKKHNNREQAIQGFLKNLWHLANEQPKYSKWIMTQFLDDDNDIVFEIGRALANFDTACRDLVNLVNDQLFESSRSPYWVADEVGGICDFGDTDFLTPEEMVLILKHGVSYDDYVEWREANIKYGDTKSRIKLKSWLRGCRHDQSPGLLAMPTTPTMPIGPNINTIKKS